ncbi:MAG: restriction endonuclease [Candidatus Eisenbacteria bacterium]|nr:restriction endonuclease [Candidatus Eisenbacteria bacterium]
MGKQSKKKATGKSPYPRIVLLGWVGCIISISLLYTGGGLQSGGLAVLGVGLLLFSLFVVLVALVNHAGYKRQQMKEEREQKAKELGRKIDTLVASGDYGILENFVRKYRQMGCDEGNLIQRGYDKGNLVNLLVLLSRKGTKLDVEELTQVIHEEELRQDYENLKTKILSSKPKGLEQYVRSMLEVCGDSQEKYTDLFKRLLKENGVGFEEGQLAECVKNTIWEVELSRFEKNLANNAFQASQTESLDSASGVEFERFLKTLFEGMGYSVRQTKSTGDQGADLIVTRQGERTVVQAKRHQNKVTNKAIQEAVAAIKHYRADRGMVVTTSEFTRSAVELANSNAIELIDRRKLEELVRKFL